MRDLVVLNDAQRKAVQEHALTALCEFDRLCKSHHINYTLAYGTLIGAIRHKGFIPWDDDVDVCVSRYDLLKLRLCANSELNNGFFYQTQSTDKNWYRLYDKIRVDGTVFREIAHENEEIHQGIYIDVFPIDYLPNNKFLSKCQVLLYGFFSTVLSAKYLSLRHLHGFNKLAAVLLRVVFFPLKKKWLYNMAEKIACCSSEGEYMCSFESAYKEIFPNTVFEKFIDMDFDKYKFSCVSNYDYWLKTLYGNYWELPPEGKRVTTHALSELKTKVG